MAQLYKYYQAVGGSEPWTPIQATADLSEIKPTFATVLALDTLLDESPTRDQIDATKYQGPLYFDFDDEITVDNAITGAKELLAKLIEAGLQPEDFDIFLSGKKGVHVVIPQTCFVEKVTPTAKLPAIYKEIAFKFATDTMDFRVYTARKGRMWRTCYNVRENGNYRVPVAYAEFQALSGVGYTELCKTPRHVTASQGKFRAKFSLVYEVAKQKILSQKRKKLKPTDAVTLKKHEPIVARLMNGETNGSAGFNNIALQVGLYAREARMTVEELVVACDGLIKKHVSDGYRYATERKRENEIRRMFLYLEDNSGYDYAIDPIKALISKAVNPDDPGYADADESEVASGGVFLSGGCYYAAGENSDRLIMAGSFTDSEPLLDPKTNLIATLRVNLTVPGKNPIKLSVERSEFTSSASLHRAVSPAGISFLGSDTQARSIYEIMLRKMGSKYVIESEGINLINIPKSEHLAAREPFLVWADSSGVRLPPHIAELGIEFEFQGFPTAEGALQTDLTNAPPLSTWIATPENKERLKKTLLNLFGCHQPEPLSKILGWMIACNWRQLFHGAYSQFPLLHVNGAAGAGKSQLIGSLLSLFYWKQVPKELTPGSSLFAFTQVVCGSASIPVMLDEYKPSAMANGVHDRYKLTLRDAYNKRDVSRGGGNRQKESFNAISTISLSGPVVFVAEAIDTETALLERCVLATIKRQPTVKARKTYLLYEEFKANKEVLSILGHNIAAHVTRTSSVDKLREDFGPIYHKARQRFMPQAGDDKKFTDSEVEAKISVQERAVFNVSVADFGLAKLESLLKSIYAENDEFNTFFKEWIDLFRVKVFSQMDDMSKNTMPEFLKVLCSLSDLTRVPDSQPMKMVNGEDYVLTEEGGHAVLALSVRSSYAKYRAWHRLMGINALFTGDTSFNHSLKDAPQFIRPGFGTKTLVVDTCVFDYDALVRAGVPPFAGKPMNIPV